MDLDQVQRVRAGIPALKRYVWFQNGGVSVTPGAIAEEHIRLMRELLTRGPMHIVYPDEEYPRREQSIARLAQFFGVDRAELALMRGVSEGYQTILRGLPWQPGDQIITTVEEEASVFLPTLHVRDRQGVDVIKAPLVGDIEGQCEAIESRITGRTRLIVLSHVTTDLGFRLPVKQICQLARDRNVLTFLDMAHSMGLYPINLHEIGCDFAGILSYKWMYAPYAAGALYARQERLHDVAVTYAGGRSEAWLDYETNTYALQETAGRFEYGPWSWPLVHAWAFAAGYLTEIGRDAIWVRTVDLTTRLKQGLAAIPGVTLFTPMSPRLSAALVSFSVAGWEGKALTQALRERWNIIVKPILFAANGLRVSVPFFLLEEEIDLLLEAIATLAASRQSVKGTP